ncbi:D-alanyl-D-alanine carboxypeptidase/D-alanyl-D-alanine endopeptidase [Actinoplanes utahensis]|uniref:D-alanyl-D-alanine carboxypeptidase/D-alanyl-D-alanine endopeptidase n=1 Tax=Actinoplanes utahensis TaxID=1869 RepID=UPI00068F62F2|nr:D-alanyl-D-alanine carboxypeptidase/D-alanyl-D-alanine-endopeptidase [Actinoplanes utahensis]GIF27382.1 D-alanyl-D-alanine carboxypeptidase DacC [Actinoplanes utahensis]
MRTALASLVTGVLLLMPVPASAAASLPATAGPSATALIAGTADPLATALDRVLADGRLSGATVAVDVRDTAGTVLYQRDAGRRVLPASNQKLLTAAAALEVLGPGYRFRTTVRARGGDLHLQGTGDPTMTYARYDRLAAAVARGATRRFPGRLIADDTWFDRVPLGLDWSWEDEPYGYSAPVSALTFAANDRFDAAAVELRYRGVAGGRPVLTVWPPGAGVRLLDRTVTGATDTVTAVRAHGTGTIVVAGSVPAGRQGAALVSVPDPAATAARLFRAALRRHGVTVSGRTIKGSTPPDARVLTAQTSPPLTEILPSFLKLSNNGHAELLVKAMSRASVPTRPGSWPTGLTAAVTALRRLGVDTRLLTMGDGSGLSRRNWLTARQVTTLLLAARRRPWFPAFHAALPLAGDPDPMIGGTLRNRLRGTAAAGNLRAKTGTLTGVDALSGYLTDAGGRRLVFAAVVNGSPAPATAVLDGLAVALAQSGTRAVTTRARWVQPRVS